MVDDRGRVVAADDDAGRRGHVGGHRPRRMHVAVGHAGQLGDPAPDVRAVGVVPPPLRHRVEDPEPRLRVRARAGGPLPPTVVAREVAVHEALHEVPLPRPPVDEQVLGKEACHDHARPVMHPAGGSKLAHRGIDDREAGPAAPPCVEPDGVVAPREAVVHGPERAARGVREVEEHLGVEVPPGELVREGPGAVPRPAGAVEHLDGGEEAPPQILREPARPVGTEEVAAVGVRVEPGRDPAVEPRPRRRLAGRRDVAQRWRGYPEIADRRHAPGPVRPEARVAGDAPGRGQRNTTRSRRPSPSVRSEDRVRAPLAGEEVLGLDDEQAGHRMECPPVRRERRGDGPVAGAGVRAHVAAHEDVGRVRLRRERGDRRGGRTRTDDERGAARGEVRGERLERGEHEGHARRGAVAAAEERVVEDERRHDPVRAPDRRMESGMVVEPEVSTEPGDHSPSAGGSIGHRLVSWYIAGATEAATDPSARLRLWRAPPARR